MPNLKATCDKVPSAIDDKILLSVINNNNKNDATSSNSETNQLIAETNNLILSSSTNNTTNLNTNPQQENHAHAHEDDDTESNELEIAFYNLNYTVQTGIFKKETKTILKGITGCFRPGELSVIVGPSGAGKSSLLHLLSAYQYSGYTGDITVNGKPRVVKLFKPYVAYIAQDTNLQPYLTVKEAMYFAANLKIGNYMSANDKRERVKKVLTSIGIYEDRHTRTGELSGGQKKRLSIALEVVNDPPVLILDEPTSGLDSSTSNNCVTLLKNLALEGRTVICTIHQPSALTFYMFDHLYALADGQCIYSGSTRNLVPFLTKVDLPCPEFYNPSDYLMEIATDDYGELKHHLVAEIANGCNEKYRQKSHTQRKKTDTFLSFSTLRDMVLKKGGGSISGSAGDAIDGAAGITKSQKSSRKSSLYTIPRPHLCRHENVYATPFYKQLYILMMRSFLIYWRDPSLIFMRFTIHLFIGLLIGFLYFNIGNDASNALNNFRYAYYSIMFVMFSSFSAVLVKFPLEFPIISREHFNRWYSLRAYYMAMTLNDMPIQIICTSVYCFITYFMTGQPLELFRCIYFILMVFLTAIVAQSIGLTVGAAMNVNLGAIIGPFFITPFFAFSGFFLQHKDAPSYMRWLFHVSFLKYGLDGCMLALFGFEREKLPCHEIYCHYALPKFFLKDIDMIHADYERSLIVLIILLVLLRLLAFYVMKMRLRLIR